MANVCVLGQRILKLLVAVTVQSFHTVYFIFAPYPNVCSPPKAARQKVMGGLHLRPSFGWEKRRQPGEASQHSDRSRPRPNPLVTPEEATGLDPEQTIARVAGAYPNRDDSG